MSNLRQKIKSGFRGLQRYYLRCFPVTGLRILAYHRTQNEETDSLTVSPARFEEQMQYLADHRQVISISDAVALLQADGADNRGLEDKAVITFDDGYLCNYQYALPVLHKMGLPAIIYFVVGKIASGDEEFMSWDQVREIQRMGFEIGSHTINHLKLTTLSPTEAEAECAGSFQALDDGLGTSKRHFCYPHGEFNRASAAIVSRYYQSATGARRESIAWLNLFLP